MLEYIEIKNADDTLKIELTNPETSGYVIKKIDGLGPADADINITAIAGSDISLFNSARISKKNLKFEIMPYLLGRTETIEELRLRLYSFFPTKKNVRIYFKTDTRHVYIDGYVETHQPNIFSEEESINISVICSDPFFYDVDSEAAKERTGGTIKQFTFPFSNPSIDQKKIIFGSITHHTEHSFNYEGEYTTGFVATMTLGGNVVDPVIYDIQYKEQLRLLSSVIEEITGSGLKTGDVIYINTIPSQKAITLKKSDGVLYNILDAMDIDVSTWLTIKPGRNGYATDAREGGQHIETEYKFAVAYGGI